MRRNPLFTWLFAKYLFGDLHKNSNLTVNEKYQFIVRRLCVFYILSCIILEIATKHIQYTFVFILQEPLLYLISNSRLQWTGTMMYISLHVYCTIWYVFPPLLVLFAEDLVMLFLGVSACVYRYYYEWLPLVVLQIGTVFITILTCDSPVPLIRLLQLLTQSLK